MNIVERERQETEVLTEREQRARTLEAAALEIEARGWVQGRDCDEDGRVCALGALAFASGWGGRGSYSIGGDFFKALDAFTEVGEPQRFNDAPGRTAKEVTDLLRWRASEIRDGR